jgi:hypothetical protein
MIYSIDHAVGVARDLTDRLRLRLGNQIAPNALNNVTQSQDEWGYPIIVVSNATDGAGEGNPAVWIRITNLFEQSGSPEVSPAGAPVDIFGNATLPFTPTVCQLAYELTAGTFTVSSANATAGAVYTSAAGQSFTVESTIAAQTTLVTSGNMNPSAASGTLTKLSGTGDATITYSAFAGFNLIPAASDYSTCLFEIARTGMVVQEFAIANGNAATEAAVAAQIAAGTGPIQSLKDIDWGFKGNT